MKIIFLQSDAALAGGAMFTMLIMMVVLFLVFVFITRWIFGIPTLIRQSKAQSLYLSQIARLTERMAEQQGISREEIHQIKQTAHAAQV